MTASRLAARDSMIRPLAVDRLARLFLLRLLLRPRAQ
jgi:hypothetical protein